MSDSSPSKTATEDAAGTELTVMRATPCAVSKAFALPPISFLWTVSVTIASLFTGAHVDASEMGLGACASGGE